MNGSKFDILIVVSEKDFNKIPFLWRSIWKNLYGFKDIYFISDIEIPNKYKFVLGKYYLDEQVIDFDFSKFEKNIKIRTGWYKQQFIKLFQEVTSDDYLVIDSDVFINKHIELFKNNTPYFLLGENQNHIPYFIFMMEVFGLSKCYNYSFINEMMLFKREIIKRMISNTGFSKHGFFEIAVKALNRINHKTSSFSEYETYGNYVTCNYPRLYGYKYLKTERVGKHGLYSDDDIKNIINSYKDKDIDKISIHSWI